MDSSLQSAKPTAEELKESVIEQVATEEAGGEEHHIHLPNPSLWPLILSAAIGVTIFGLLSVPDNPWIAIVGVICVFISIVALATEDPMAPRKEQFTIVPLSPHSKFAIGQEVVDKDGQWVGTVQARFPHYILVERGSLFGKAFYVPDSLISNELKNGTVHLTVDEAELLNRGLDALPDDLYEETPELGIPQVKGVPLFARGPLSPAETGHYNYGPNFPGMNTDASGSYHREEVFPTPQKYVAERRKLVSTSKAIPPRSISPD